MDRDIIGFMKKGFCRCYYIDNCGNDITRSFVPEGDFIFTELRLVGDEAQFAVEACEDCEILVLDLQRILESARENLPLQNEMYRIYIALLEQIIKEKVIRDSSFLMKDAQGRYEEFCENFPEVEQRAKRRHIASYLGITSVSLSRIRSKMRNLSREFSFIK